jgi:hypothetical protein
LLLSSVSYLMTRIPLLRPQRTFISL